MRLQRHQLAACRRAAPLSVPSLGPSRALAWLRPDEAATRGREAYRRQGSRNCCPLWGDICYSAIQCLACDTSSGRDGRAFCLSSVSLVRLPSRRSWRASASACRLSRHPGRPALSSATAPRRMGPTAKLQVLRRSARSASWPRKAPAILLWPAQHLPLPPTPACRSQQQSVAPVGRPSFPHSAALSAIRALPRPSPSDASERTLDHAVERSFMRLWRSLCALCRNSPLLHC